MDARQDSYLTLPYNESTYAELDRLTGAGTILDGVIIDLMQTGFSLQMDHVAKFVNYAKKLLSPRGVMLLIKSESVMTLSRDHIGGGLVIDVYDTPYGALTRYPLLASHASDTVPGIDRRRLLDCGGTLSNHILLSSMPVLTPAGKTAKRDHTLIPSKNWVVQLIDDYTSIESIVHKLDSRQLLSAGETLSVIQELENQKLIYPIFSRVQFLTNCYQSRKPFRLGRYMLACGIVNEVQLQELLEKQQEEGWGESQRTFLGMLAVRAGFVNMRELQVLLADQYLYGGYHRLFDEHLPGFSDMVDANIVRDSMIGSLSTIDPPGLLQSLNTANKTGLLTSEDRDKVIMVAFLDGRPTHAKMNELKGVDALAEFITTWTDGIFVFRDGGMSHELDKSTLINEAIDRVLLDSALYHDNINQILAGFPQGVNSVFERVSDFDQLWAQLYSTPLHYMDESEVTTQDRKQIFRMAHHINGLATVNEVIDSFPAWPTHRILKAIELLVKVKLISEQKGSLFRPMDVFQHIVSEMKKHLGSEESKLLLHSSLHYAHGESPSRMIFQIDQEGCVSINLTQLKTLGMPVSSVLPDLRQWMEAYLSYCRQRMDAPAVDRIVAQIIESNGAN